MKLVNAARGAHQLPEWAASVVPAPLCGFALALLLANACWADETAQPSEDPNAVLQPIQVTGVRIANREPASGYAAVATALRYDPQIDLQSRGLPEAQSDITVRGGVFENTGFRIGAVSIFDPQTGHYSVELPIAPEQLSAGRILTDADNSLAAFNAAVGTVHYQLAELRPGGQAQAGFGNDSLLHASVLAAFDLSSEKSGSAADSGLGFSAAASSGDGTVNFGDHEFQRFSMQYQYLQEDSSTQVLLGYQDKFFGWPGMYTGFATLPETDHTKLGLLLVDHRRELQNGWWQATAAYRWLEDDYDFDRRTPDLGGPGSFEHKTRNVALGLAGELRSASLDWHFSAQLSSDHLVDSTDLTLGDFTTRNYLNVALVPQHRWELGNASAVVLRGGLRADFSDRDEDAVLPVAGVRWEKTSAQDYRWLALEYTGQSQLPGYTALKSPPRGLFGGNPNLERAYADTATLSAGWEASHVWAKAAVFHRRDDDLVDWTYRQSAPSVRQANPVDLEVNGVELSAGWQSQQLDVIAAFTALDKEEDYGTALVDASYYALNYARQRMTLAVLYRPWESLELRLDNEYREQEENSLRRSSDDAYLGAVSLNWQTPLVQGLRLSLIVDNFTDDDFQEFPGTPAPGRQYSLNAGVEW
jgi:vitamin B12 transporter